MVYLHHKSKEDPGEALLAAWAVVATENPADLSVIFPRNTGQQAMLKYAAASGATPIAGHFMPATLVNQIQAAFRGATSYNGN